MTQDNPAKDRKNIAQQLMKLGEELSKAPTIDDRKPDDILYDQDGLPKNDSSNQKNRLTGHKGNDG